PEPRPAYYPPSHASPPTSGGCTHGPPTARFPPHLPGRRRRHGRHALPLTRRVRPLDGSRITPRRPPARTPPPVRGRMGLLRQTPLHREALRPAGFRDAGHAARLQVRQPLRLPG